jgi:hypothetical protein
VSTTVVVALITALSTLIGVVTTGYLTLLAGRAQLRAQQKSTELNRNEQRAKHARDIRRDVYLGFMTQLTRVEEIFDRDLWLRAGFGADESVSPGEVMYTATAVMQKLALQLDLIRLEGPSNVSEAALSLYSVLDTEMMQVMLLAKQGQTGRTLRESEMYRFWQGTSQVRKEVKAAFIESARGALDESINDEV